MCFRLLVAKGVDEKGRIHKIIQMAAKINIQVEYVPRQQIDAMGENPQGIALQTNPYPYSDLHEILQQPQKRGESLFMLLLDVLQDPQNLGTLLRTAEAVGIHGVFMPANRAASVTPAVVHASSGASEHLLVAQGNLAQAITAIKDAGGWVMGLEGGPGSPAHSPDAPGWPPGIGRWQRRQRPARPHPQILRRPDQPAHARSGRIPECSRRGERCAIYSI